MRRTSFVADQKRAAAGGPRLCAAAQRPQDVPADCKGKKTMPQIRSIERLKVPLGGQEIELQHLVHDGGGMPLLRVRIREKSRFTIFDIDPVTARSWGEAMRDWGASRQPEAEPGGAG
jgi:hypothetical protein